jgi:hypothetical protein
MHQVNHPLNSLWHNIPLKFVFTNTTARVWTPWHCQKLQEVSFTSQLCYDPISIVFTGIYHASYGLTNMNGVGYEVFMVVKIQVQFFWIVTMCSVAVGYKCFRSPCCLHLHWRWHRPLIPWYPTMLTQHHNPEELNLVIWTVFRIHWLKPVKEYGKKIMNL